jgi:hypothetical protein
METADVLAVTAPTDPVDACLEKLTDPGFDRDVRGISHQASRSVSRAMEETLESLALLRRE